MRYIFNNAQPNKSLSERYKLYSFSLEFKPVHGFENSLFHLNFSIFLLIINFKLLHVLEVLIKDKSILLHPTFEVNFFGEDFFLELVLLPYNLYLFLCLFYNWFWLLGNILFSLCLLFGFQFLLSQWIQNTFLIFLNLKEKRSLE